jgi:ABC-2 type transport system ATP-binding protein
MDSGSVRISGADILNDPITAKKAIGYLPDEPPVHDDMYVEDFVKYAASINLVPANRIQDRVKDTLDRLDLTSVKNRVVGNLSKGYRQRVALSQAIVHEPKVLVLDEPTEGLDPNQIVEIRNLIHELKSKHTIILSSHILSEVENTCDEIVIIHEGKILKKGSKSSLEAALTERRGHHYIIKVQGDVDLGVSLLSEYKGITGASKVADSFIEFRLDGEERIIGGVVAKLVGRGLEVLEVRPETSTLEDVFFSLTREKH